MAGEVWVSSDNCSGSSKTNLTYTNGTTLCHRWWRWGEWGLHTRGFLYSYNASAPVRRTPLSTIRRGQTPLAHYWSQCDQSSDSWCHNASDSTWLPMAGLPGLYWLCGRWAYKTLPHQWSGWCTLEWLLPYTYGMQTMHAHAVHNYILVACPRRSPNPIVQRPTGFHQFVRSFLPWLGVAELERAIVNISVTLEIIENNTTDAVQALQLEVASLLQVILQNHMALDYLLAAQGGICALINESCCFYSNQDKCIETAVHNMMDHLKVLHDVGSEASVWDDPWRWLTSWLPDLGAWGRHIRLLLLIGLLGFVCVFVILQCCVNCSFTLLARLAAPKPVRTLKVRWWQ
ncbi:unnamed protein product [Eretmochelys imbricata]